jgi:uncharacterized protein YmfQ (DUF2313 family)
VSESVLHDLLAAQAELLAEVEVRSRDLHEEADLRTVLELLPEWAAFLDLANDCTDGLPETLVEQRFAAYRKVVLPGGQNRFHFAEVARGLGYDIDIQDIHEFFAFVVEASAVEDPIYDDAWAFVAEIHSTQVTPRFARAGLTVAGEPLVTFGNELLECTLDAIKPAHCLFLYVYDAPYVGYAPWNSAAPAPVALALQVPIPSRF